MNLACFGIVIDFYTLPVAALFLGSSSLRARFDLKEGPSTAQTIAVQFQCNGSTLSKIDFQLNTDNYKLSLVKRKIVTGM